MTEHQFRTLLAEKGFAEPVIVEREAHSELDQHDHPFEAMALILEGDITLFTEDGVRTYLVGDIFHLQAGQPHRETFGAQGVRYLAGRKLS
ncbi:cupin domain-containing protein [Pantoea stewartii]|uniref:cupin domain-containing protein n=1 Tax=Pantoea stewartii TaxID=66269 RepID=UPI003367244A